MDVQLKTEHNGDLTRLAIIGELSIYYVAELKPQILDLLRNCRELEINLSEVSDLDTAGFQLLYLLKREGRAADKPVRLVAHSSATLEVLEMLQMEAWFGDPLVLAS